MPGMSSGLKSNSPIIISAFHQALFYQFLLVLLLGSIGLAFWVQSRSRVLRLEIPSVPAKSEPLARRVIRLGFGLLWILDGFLQMQSSMPLGFTSQVVKPVASNSPAWISTFMGFFEGVWNYHPVTSATAIVWIQIGLGLWLIVSGDTKWSRYGGLTAFVWGLFVWGAGEGFGQLGSPGQSWLFGLPGAALFYSLAGILLFMPSSGWTGERLQRYLKRGLGGLFIAMSLLQGWPGRGFWQGGTPKTRSLGSLALMIHQMSQTPQPDFLSSLLRHIFAFDLAHGWMVNLVATLGLLMVGLLMFVNQGPLVKVGILLGITLCSVTWVLVQDLGFLGGTGTDPNSMVPQIIFLAALGLTGARWISPTQLVQDTEELPEIAHRQTGPAYRLRVAASIGACGVILIGVIPGAYGATHTSADSILTQALNGAPQPQVSPLPKFSLVNQNGQEVSNSSLIGKVVALTFLDDVCVSTCPLIAQEFKRADSLIGSISKKVVLVAINSNPRFISTNYLQAFDRQEGLSSLVNWEFLTGTSYGQLALVWRHLGALVELLPGGSMVDHSEIAYIVGPKGNVRYLVNTDPGQATGALNSSFSGELAGLLKEVART